MGVQESQRLRDPVYGLIVFGGGPDAHMRETDQIAWKLINTREFQRLRRRIGRTRCPAIWCRS